MKKQLNTEAIKNELAGSVFFPSNTTPPVKQERTFSAPLLPQKENERNAEVSNQASERASTNASNQASMLACSQEMIETIRKIVKTPAKEEVLYVRVTKEEKNQLGDIEYTYQRRNIATSANELGRIAVNFLITDYKANGENSLLAKVLAALNA